MPNFNGVWSLTTQLQYAADWPSAPTTPIGLFQRGTTIESITITTTGNATDFGDKTTNISACAACGSSTRGIFGGGESTTNVIDFVIFDSAGNATDFGDLATSVSQHGGCSSLIRGVFAGGANSNGSIEYVTIASTGDGTDFGDLGFTTAGVAGCSAVNGGLTQ